MIGLKFAILVNVTVSNKSILLFTSLQTLVFVLLIRLAPGLTSTYLFPAQVLLEPESKRVLVQEQDRPDQGQPRPEVGPGDRRGHVR